MISRIVRIGADLLGAAATLAGVAGIALHFGRWSAQLPVLAASAAPYLMGSAVIGAVAFLFVRRWSGAAVSTVVLIAGVAVQAPLYLSAPGSADGPVVRMMQANLLFDGTDPRTFVDQVRAHDIDVLTVNELTPAAVAGLAAAGIDELLPHRYLAPGRTASGTGLWSRHPLSDTVEYDGYVLNQLSATAQIPGAGPVSVYAIHPVPPIYDTGVWADELARLRTIVENAPADRPALVGGDFNATHDHRQFRDYLTGRFADAADQAGAGHLATYPTDKWWPAVVGIDHILVAGGTALTVEALDLPGSDHRALVAEIRLDPH
ncbi:endonuclease/exonuclease/phosphatase family protein [Nocardia farcinica]|uniref:endonuclease/exonuclease/phosphatase family protein n=1 Tax=Nocardia farcinica TaxID=37329 RepID=UPI0024552621|nr:endonuclease/exonuclease/phosphatase family protein [Nocardia farcinica]